MAAKKKAPAKKKATKKKAAKRKSAAPTAEPKAKKADIREVGKYALLLTQKLEAEDKVKKINKQLTDLFNPVLDYFQRQGIDQIAAGGRTLYLRREVVTNKNTDFTQKEACDRLRHMGLNEYAGQRVNIQGLAAHVRELEVDGQDLKDIEADFGGAFNVVELFKIGSRKR
jgi:hypothetical protein